MQSPQDHILNITGKPPNSYQIIAFIVKVCRKHYIIALPQQQTNKLEHPPLQSPHTRVCGKRRVYDKFNNTIDIKTKTNTTTHMLIQIDTLTRTHIIKSKLTRPYPNIDKQRNNTLKVLGRVTTKNQITNHLASMKHKLTKHNLHKNVTKSISPLIFKKRIKTHTQYKHKTKPYIWKSSQNYNTYINKLYTKKTIVIKLSLS